jgi:hypothetical protein
VATRADFLVSISFLKNVRVVFLNLVSALSLLCACTSGRQNGTLTVRYVGEGSFEIYKMAGEHPLQFVSETTSQFNERIMLQPGSYMILADCSSEVVNIYPGSDITLVAHSVNFIPLLPPSDSDKFSIQCLRSERTHNRQSLMNHFSLAVLAGTRELLVGMIPLRLDLPATESKESRVVSHVLSYISVKATGAGDKDDFFVSPVGGVTPFTENQRPGSKLFVLHGKYDLQLNGSELTVELDEGESRIITPGRVMVATSPNADIARAEKVRGSPLFAELNGEHYLDLNTTYPVLPSTLNIRLSTSLHTKPFKITEGQDLKIHARNVVVELDCAVDDWSCLGAKKILLFEKNENNYFAESRTDVPIMFFEDDVDIGIEGARNIKLNLGAADDQRIKVGFLEVVPTPQHKPGILTDLMRVEPNGGKFIGNSLDLAIDKPTVMALLVGQYRLAQYTFSTSDGSRRKVAQNVTISQGQRVTLEVQTFLSEKKMTAISSPSEDSSKP